MDGSQEERRLLSLAVALGAQGVEGWSDSELRVIRDLPSVSPHAVRLAREAIEAGQDPLGEAFCSLRSPETRRLRGATYTPEPIVRAMTAWAKRRAEPARVVDPGAGSGRFAVSAGRAFPEAELIAVELDPVAAILCRGHIAAVGLSERARVICEDFRAIALQELPQRQRTLFLGNPPYVRHHQIEAKWKSWLRGQAKRLGLRPSTLAGLHVHFFLATANLARPGDIICYVTSAEWLDVNYGRMLRDLMMNGLGAQRFVVVEPTARAFPDAQTTAAISCLKVGSNPKSILVQRARSCVELGELDGGRRIAREHFESGERWSNLTRRRRGPPDGFVELGEICRVHRGAVTGANQVWVVERNTTDLPDRVLFPSVTRAKELYAANGRLDDDSHLKRVIDLPADLDQLDDADRSAVERFLWQARRTKAHEGYIARHRNPWWKVGLRRPAPILATYMARRPPAFVRNAVRARHLNIAHGLYPRFPMDESFLQKLADYLNANVTTAEGRTYAGGLTKFEPREMERLWVPEPTELKLEAEP